jgi:hypothetical protein
MATPKPNPTRQQVKSPMVLHLLLFQRRSIMFEKFGDAAEKLAISVSRRAFLGRLGQSALGLAAVVGGILAFPAQTQAANGDVCCLFGSIYTGFCKRHVPKKTRCITGGAPFPCDSSSLAF